MEKEVRKEARSCITHLAPELKGSLPHSNRAIKTWEILEGNKERGPLCKEAAGSEGHNANAPKG